MTALNELPRSSAASMGISPAAILAFIEDAEATTPQFHSMMLLRHGQVVAEGWWAPYGPDLTHMLFSLSKSFTSSAVGFAVSEGKIDLDDTVLSYFADEAPAEVSDNLAAMKVRHLLSMSTGHHEDTTEALFTDESGDWARAFLARPVEHEPGTWFVYNSGATYMCSAIVQRVTGQTVVDYLTPRLFEPLGIEGAFWDTCPKGVNTGGWGLNVKTEDIARLGQFYLQDGVWQGKRLLPSEWVAMATSKQSDNDNGTQSNPDWRQGYGFQFWRCRHNAYRGDGAFGQYCLVMPDQDAVLAITSGVKDMQAVLDLVWKHLLPAMRPDPVPEEPEAQAALEAKLASLAVPAASGAVPWPQAAGLSGVTYSFEENPFKVEAVTVEVIDHTCTLVVRNDLSEHRLTAKMGEWLLGETTLSLGPGRHGPDDAEPTPVAASAAWTSANALQVQVSLYLTPFMQTLTLAYGGDDMTLKAALNVGFGPDEPATLVGHKA